ncbi:hypothetical protein EVAR_53903_1 [Eumeta japonica]|uniref:Uncharacterized protein n=1 Tax=Eumeta variegata TaxID=151549 RepID=A0A4C1YEQ6_EUMVA|nr:hypothetical protein EVAR_53903_1 [Eumeta japonica]
MHVSRLCIMCHGLSDPRRPVAARARSNDRVETVIADDATLPFVITTLLGSDVPRSHSFSGERVIHFLPSARQVAGCARAPPLLINSVKWPRQAHYEFDSGARRLYRTGQCPSSASGLSLRTWSGSR